MTVLLVKSDLKSLHKAWTSPNSKRKHKAPSGRILHQSLLFQKKAACSLCGAKMERVMIMSHEHDKCPQRLLACVYCEFPVAAADLETHSNVCGSRTELCIPCGKYVRLRERIGHDLQYHSQNNETGTSSRDYTLLQSVPSVSDIPRRPDPHRRPASTASRQLLVTFVVTGVAILIGTVLFQRRAPSHEQQ
ncbi:hypothetical protein O6H91_14G071400 [Diphasiastrum complanatum]|uniref:Uncharacterized protein n=1 Tax=Diphasiastrum complanatum TaxID=34168 RepID=A0ACC2BQP1_DIPCM|nr:hypothetical protein O6H91_14G071400 [Diphasiastrum complanatum]